MPPMMQGWASFKGPSQGWPLPALADATPRALNLRPLQASPWHAVHAPQSSKRQSASRTQGSSWLQDFCSLDKPSTAFPQLDASTAMDRSRKVSPVPQDAEQGHHASQSAHSPSVHASSSHFAWLQASICSRSPPWHGLQPGPGSDASSSRCRVL